MSEKLAEQVMKISQGTINICNKYIELLELSIESGEGMIILIEIVSKSAGSICLKTGWKVDKEKYHKIYKK